LLSFEDDIAAIFNTSSSLTVEERERVSSAKEIKKTNNTYDTYTRAAASLSPPTMYRSSSYQGTTIRSTTPFSSSTYHSTTYTKKEKRASWQKKSEIAARARAAMLADGRSFSLMQRRYNDDEEEESESSESTDSSFSSDEDSDSENSDAASVSEVEGSAGLNRIGQIAVARALALQAERERLNRIQNWNSNISNVDTNTLAIERMKDRHRQEMSAAGVLPPVSPQNPTFQRSVNGAYAGSPAAYNAPINSMDMAHPGMNGAVVGTPNMDMTTAWLATTPVSPSHAARPTSPLPSPAIMHGAYPAGQPQVMHPHTQPAVTKMPSLAASGVPVMQKPPQRGHGTRGGSTSTVSDATSTSESSHLVDSTKQQVSHKHSKPVTRERRQIASDEEDDDDEVDAHSQASQSAEVAEPENQTASSSSEGNDDEEEKKEEEEEKVEKEEEEEKNDDDDDDDDDSHVPTRENSTDQLPSVSKSTTKNKSRRVSAALASESEDNTSATSYENPPASITKTHSTKSKRHHIPVASESESESENDSDVSTSQKVVTKSRSAGKSTKRKAHRAPAPSTSESENDTSTATPEKSPVLATKSLSAKKSSKGKMRHIPLASGSESEDDVSLQHQSSHNTLGTTSTEGHKVRQRHKYVDESGDSDDPYLPDARNNMQIPRGMDPRFNQMSPVPMGGYMAGSPINNSMNMSMPPDMSMMAMANNMGAEHLAAPRGQMLMGGNIAPNGMMMSMSPNNAMMYGGNPAMPVRASSPMNGHPGYGQSPSTTPTLHNKTLAMQGAAYGAGSGQTLIQQQHAKMLATQRLKQQVAPYGLPTYAGSEVSSASVPLNSTVNTFDVGSPGAYGRGPMTLLQQQQLRVMQQQQQQVQQFSQGPQAQMQMKRTGRHGTFAPSGSPAHGMRMPGQPLISGFSQPSPHAHTR
jgi:hypothetical protein